MSFFSTNIKILRLSKKLKQLEVCDSMGFKTSTWNSYEKGGSEPSFDQAIKISHFFELSIADLLEIDLSNVEVIPKSRKIDKVINVVLNEEANEEVKSKKLQNKPCLECDIKDNYIVIKDEVIKSKSETIEHQKTIISLLQNQLDQMRFDIQEKKESHTTQREERKTA